MTAPLVALDVFCALQELDIRRSLARLNPVIGTGRRLTLCKRCRRRPSSPGNTSCDPCLKDRQRHFKAMRARMRAEGRCYRCRRVVGDTRTHCAECRAYRKGRRERLTHGA